MRGRDAPRESDCEPIVAANEAFERDLSQVSYEEFGGTQDYVNCPTCQGTGRVPRTVPILTLKLGSGL